MHIKLWGEENLSLASQFMFEGIDSRDYEVEHVVIVPDRFSLLAEKQLLEILPGGILFNVKVTTFSAFSQQLLQLSGNASLLASAGERLLYIQKAAEQEKKNFQYFKKSNINFCAQLLNTLSLLSSSRVSAQDLQKEGKARGKKKLEDIALVYSRYLEFLGEKLDPALLFEKLLCQKSVQDFVKNKKIYFAQFDSFTAQMYEVIKFLAFQSKEINISFAISKNFGNEYIYEKDLQAKIVDIAKSLGCQIDVLIGQKQKPQSQAVMLKQLYSSQIEKSKKTQFYQSFMAFTKRQEVENVAKIIAQKVGQGQRFSSFAVALGSLEAYQDLVEEIFAKFNINFYLDSSLNAFQSLIARELCSFLSVYSQGFSQEALLQFFASPIVNLAFDCQSTVEEILQKQVDGKWKYKMVLRGDVPFKKMLDSLEKIENYGQLFDLINNFLLVIEPCFEKYLAIMEEKALFKEANIERQAFEVLRQTLETIISVKGKQSKADVREFLKELELLLSSKEISSVPTLVDGVMVGDATESFFESRKTLFVLGGQLLPKIIGDNALLNDSDIKSPIMQKVVKPTSRMINRRNRFALFNLLTQQWKGLYISFHAISDDGKLVTVPAFIDQLNQIFDENLRVVEDEYRTEIVLPEEDEDLFKEDKTLSKQLFFKNGSVSASQLESYFSCPFKHFARYGLKLKERKSFAFDQRDVGNFCHKAVEKFVAQFVGIPYEEEFGRADRFVEENFDKILLEENLQEKLDLVFEKEGLIKFLKFQLKTILNSVELELKNSCYQPLLLEEKVKQKLFGGLVFTGKIDRVDVSGEFFRIIDYKTGKPQSLVKDLYYGDKLQLFLYSIPIQEKLKKHCGGVFYFDCRFDYEEQGQGKCILKGLAENLDENLLLFDKNLQERGKSSILQLALSSSKTKSFIGNAVAKRSLNFYQTYALKIAQKACDEICQGFKQPKPDEKACENCPFGSFCHYQKTFGTRIKNFSEEVFKEKDDGSDR